MTSFVRVDSAPDLGGRGLFATTDIKTPGTHLCELTADFATVLDVPRLEDTCSGCFNVKRYENGEPDDDEDVKLRLCAGCRVVRYCSSACQEDDWKRMHKKECKIFKRLFPEILPAPVRALLHVVLRKTFKDASSQQELAYLHQLICHIDEIRDFAEEQLERIELTTRAIKRYSLTTLPEREIMRYAALCDTSCFGLTNAFGDKIGLSLIPYAAFCNHNCEPNAAVSFDGRLCMFRALRPIKKNEQIFISYFDPTTPYRIRNSVLDDHYCFQCRCRKCTADVACRRDRDPSPQTTEAYMQIDLGNEQLEDFNNPTYALGAYWSAKGLLQSANYTHLDHPYPLIIDSIIPLLICLRHFKIAFGFAAARCYSIDLDLHPSTAYPVRCVHNLVLAKLALWLSHQGQPCQQREEDKDKAYPRYEYVRTVVDGQKFDYGLVAYTVLMRMGQWFDTEPESLKNVVRQRIAEVRKEYMAAYVDGQGLTTEQANNKLKEGRQAQWKKLKLCGKTVAFRDLKNYDDHW